MNLLFNRDSWGEITTTIKKNKTRTIITVIGTLWGMFLLIALLGSAKAMENGFNSLFGDFATNSIFMWGGITSIPHGGFQRGRRIQLTTREVDMIKRKVPEIKLIAPRSQGGWGVDWQIIYGLKSYSFVISGDYPILDKVDKKKMIYGRFLNQRDIENKRKVTVITEDVYKQLFDKDENPLGKYIKINQIQFQIIGVNKSNEKIPIDSRETLYIPFSTFQEIFARGNKISWMIINLYDKVNAVEVENKIKSILKERYNVHPDDTQAFRGFNMSERFGKMMGFITGMKFLTVVVGLMTLLAGIIGISSILLIAVKERTREIGIRRALGATPSDVRNQILMESIFLTLVAGIIGVVVGVLTLALFSLIIGEGGNIPFINPTVSFYTIFGALFIMVFLGTLVGLIPAQKAISIKPIDALRDE